MAGFAPAPAPAPQQDQALPMAATPDAFGAGVAAAGEQAAASMQQRLLQANQIKLNNQYDADLMTAQVARAQARTQVAAAVDSIQRDQNLSLPDYTNRVNQAVDTILTPVSNGITNTRIARQMNAELAEDRASYATQANDWQTMQVAGQANGQAMLLKNTLDSQAIQSPTLDGLQPIREQWATAVHSMAGLTPDQRSSIAISGNEEFALVWARVNANSEDPNRWAAVRDAFQNGQLEAAGVKGSDLAMIERTINSRGDHFANLAKSAQKNQITATEGQVEEMKRTTDAQGLVPLTQALPMLQSVNTQLDQTTDPASKNRLMAMRDTLTGIVAGQQVNAKYVGADLDAVNRDNLQFQAEIAQAKAKGRPVSLEQGSYATSLSQYAAKLNGAAKTNPISLASNYGIPLTPIDWNAPDLAQQLVARVDGGTMVQKHLPAGTPVPPALADESHALNQLLSSAPATQQLNVISHIAAAETKRPGTIAQLFGQVNAPPQYRMAAGLMSGSNPGGAQVAADMLNGYQAAEKLPQLLPKQIDQKALSLAGAALGGDLGALAGNPRAIGVVAAARGLYAQAAAQAGKTDGLLDQGLLKQSVNRAMGAYTDVHGVQRGGLGNFNGPMVLPDGASQQEVDQRATQLLPGALEAAGVKVAHTQVTLSTPYARSISQVQAATPQLSNEGLFAYQQRVGKIQWDEQVAIDNKARIARPVLPPVQFRAVGDGLYKLWTGSGYLSDAKGRQAVWNYRTGKVGF